MKRITKSVLCCIGALGCMLMALHFAWPTKCIGFVGMPKVTVAYTLSDDFEETNTGGALGSGTDGFDDTQIVTTNGTPNQDYTGVVLSGAQSLRLIVAADWVRYVLSSTQTEADFHCAFQPVALPSSGSQVLFELEQAGGAGTAPCAVYLYSTGALKIFNGTSGGAATVSTMTAGTSYRVWGHWKNDGTASVAFAVKNGAETRPTSGNNYDSVSGGNGTQAIKQVLLNNPTSEVIFDKVRLTTGALIPSIP